MPYFMKTPSPTRKFTIMKYFIVRYKVDGTFVCSENYNPLWIPFNYSIRLNINRHNDIKPTIVPFPTISQTMFDDIRSLFKYLNEDDVKWLEFVLEESHNV